MKVKFWGVRGGVPSPRRDVLSYGGNTTCIQVHASGRDFIVDAGTGIIQLGKELSKHEGGKITLLFTHLHNDHTQGFPFFGPAFSERFEFDVYAGNFFSKSAKKVLSNVMSDPFFPVPLEDLASRMRFHDIDFSDENPRREVCGPHVDAIKLHHPRDGVV